GEDDFINRMLYLDLKTYLPDDLLVKADRTSMANSMEVRVPLLDHEIVEFMASIPSSLKIKFFNRKIILKKALKGILPDFTFKKRKSGFSVPLNSWFRNELREPLNDLIFLPGHKIDFINYDFVKSMINSHVAGKADYSRQLWSILMLVLWYEKIYTFGGDNVKV
ncbi:MAG TPA: asparagine synthetase B, partial [Firmicutes bacterium]|nr:asparagine synthetase B [Bacillota bacterium]